VRFQIKKNHLALWVVLLLSSYREIHSATPFQQGLSSRTGQRPALVFSHEKNAKDRLLSFSFFDFKRVISIGERSRKVYGKSKVTQENFASFKEELIRQSQECSFRNFFDALSEDEQGEDYTHHGLIEPYLEFLVREALNHFTPQKSALALIPFYEKLAAKSLELLGFYNFKASVQRLEQKKDVYGKDKVTQENFASFKKELIRQSRKSSFKDYVEKLNEEDWSSDSKCQRLIEPYLDFLVKKAIANFQPQEKISEGYKFKHQENSELSPLYETMAERRVRDLSFYGYEFALAGAERVRSVYGKDKVKRENFEYFKEEIIRQSRQYPFRDYFNSLLKKDREPSSKHYALLDRYLECLVRKALLEFIS